MLGADRVVWAVLPVKAFTDAKCRLATRYPPKFRERLARAMLQDVIGALAATPALAGIVVVSAHADAQELGRRHGARIFAEDACEGHTAAVMSAARRLAREGCRSMLTLPGDIPCVSDAEVAALLAAHRGTPAFTIAPAHDRMGSNAIVVSPPDAVDLTFGDGSFQRHLDAARAAGIEPTIVALPGLAHDVDEPSDLARIAGMRPGPATAAFLAAQSATLLRSSP